MSLIFIIVGAIVLARGKTAGLFTLLFAAGVFAAAPAEVILARLWVAIPVASLVLALVVAYLPALLRFDRWASLLCLTLSVGCGATARIAYDRSMPEQASSVDGHEVSRGVTGPVPERVGDEREALPPTLPELEASVRQIQGKAQIEVTLVNRSERALPLDAPTKDYSPLLQPLVTVEAMDEGGDRLRYTWVAGCGAMYNHSRVSRSVLEPGDSLSFLVDLPEFYPSEGPLPEYSHLMLMNEEELRAAGRPIPPPVRKFRLSVVYDNREVLAEPFRSYLRAEGAPLARRVFARSSGIVFVDPRTGEGAARINEVLRRAPLGSLIAP